MSRIAGVQRRYFKEVHMIREGAILVLGGWGLVGRAICHELLKDEPKKIVICSLCEHESKEAVADLEREKEGLFKLEGCKIKTTLIPEWGDIFSRTEFKDINALHIKDPRALDKIIDDTFNDLHKVDLKKNFLYHLIQKYKPSAIIDSVNTATIVAYKNVYSSVLNMRLKIADIESAKKKNLSDPEEAGRYFEKVDALIRSCREHMTSIALPKLIRHVQTIYLAMRSVGTKFYIKIGTTGTGGMGLNIPYTHSEERPSQTLLTKTAVAGAQSLLLFLMANTPGTAFTKELKPAAAIAWKEIGFGKIAKGFQPILLEDNPPSKKFTLDKKLTLNLDESMISDHIVHMQKPLEAVYINTGENGLFSTGEFIAITTTGQMEYVTPEEIASAVRNELLGGNTGYNIINALKNSILKPSYRAGFMREIAVEKLLELEKQHEGEVPAFEILGPPRLSKLLYEAYLLKKIYREPKKIAASNADEMSEKLADLVTKDGDLRSRMISIGIPILMPDGKSMLRGSKIACPPYRGDNEVCLLPKDIDRWAHDGWVDLRAQNMEVWRQRMIKLQSIIDGHNWNAKDANTSSRYNRKNFVLKGSKGPELSVGEIVGWIFNDEEGGARLGFDA